MELYRLVVGAIQENCFILASDAKNAVVVDPGDESDRIDAALREKGLTLKMILLTHGHFDHIGAVNELAKAWNAPVYASEKEQKVLASTEHNRAGSRGGNSDRFHVTADVWLKDGDKFSLDELEFTAVLTPGHTAGSLCYLCGDLMFSGDTLFCGDIGRCDLYSGNFAAMLKSLDKIKTFTTDFQVLPGHGPLSTLNKERERNPYMTGEAL